MAIHTSYNWAATNEQVASITQQIADIENGSPAGVFATLEALQADATANTTDGRKRAYVVTADGKWYYWNGSEWTEGGTYQATAIADNSVTDAMLSSTGIKSQITVLNLAHNTDHTITIQAALDAKGHIIIMPSGASTATVLTGKLQIDDDTTLELGRGITLKKKDSTNDNLLINKGYLTSTRNKNICLKGGVWDFNASNNTGGTNLQLMGVIFKGVDNLKISDIDEIGNERKYCFLIVDCNNIDINNVDINNTSDGFHFQPPISNLNINNLSGITNDDFISFTMGDYSAYAIGTTGNIENVFINNIHVSDGTDQIIKMVGNGDGSCEFRNIKIQNLKGNLVYNGVYIMKQDATDLTYLKDTVVRNIVIENIDVNPGENYCAVAVGAVDGDVTIRNVNINNAHDKKAIEFAGNLSKLTLDNIIRYAASPGNTVSNVININGTLDELIITNMQANYPNDTCSGFIKIYQYIENIFIDKLYFDATNIPVLYFSVTSQTSTTRLYLSNSHIKNCSILVQPNVPIIIYITNSFISYSNKIIYMEDGCDAKCYADANVQISPNFSVNGFNANRHLALSGNGIFYNGLLSTLTPEQGNCINSINASESSGNKGLMYYTGSLWRQVAAL
jgi:hypothetical protein